MTKILVTGSEGFIGLNLISVLQRINNVAIFQYDVNNTEEDLQEALRECDVIFHLAGVNRPTNDSEFSAGNVELTRVICESLRKIGQTPRIVFSSSTQAELDNPYGVSKKMAEGILKRFYQETGTDIVVYRMPGIFGKWSRPNYNTVVATFCYNIARDLPIQVSNQDHVLQLVYIDDVVQAFCSEIRSERIENSYCFREVSPVYKITLSKLAEMINSFHKSRDTLILPNFEDNLTKCLYATYLSFIQQADFAYQLPKMKDQRGVLAEFIKSQTIGQLFVSSTKPGKLRGNHYHHTKAEKFLILSGKGIIRFKSIINTDEIFSYEVDGKELKVVDIPPGYTHSIENISNEEMIVLFWASEIYDSNIPDTDYFPVQ